MNKKYIVRLTDQERDELAAVIKKFKGTSQKVRRSQILAKADADGPNWTDERIAEAFGCRTRTIQGSLLRSLHAGPGASVGPSHRVLLHPETRQLVEHRGE